MHTVIVCLLLMTALTQTTPMLFPITIGGFDGATQLDHLLVDSLGGILMCGYTSDNSLT